jgi:hypothetical protein
VLNALTSVALLNRSALTAPALVPAGNWARPPGNEQLGGVNDGRFG